MSAPPLALYIHLPWCIRKCPYCDFNSHEQRGALPETAYVDALLEDLQHDLDTAGTSPPPELASVFIGGGTPSLFSPAAIARLLVGIRRQLNLRTPTEITLEANPGSLEASRFSALREAGITRLSLGVQSFDDDHLRRLGRIHDGHAAVRAVEAAMQAGFERLNIDLMFALPGQQPHQALRDIDTALALGAAHISHYQLTLEPNTVFYRRPPQLPDEDAIADMQERCAGRLLSAGLQQYEVSAWARPGHACRHNLNYWQYGDYLGLGAGAHGKISFPDSGEIRRYRRHRIPDNYLRRSTRQRLVHTHPVLPAERPLEFAMNALRLNAGACLALYRKRTGLPASTLLEPLQPALQQGLALLDEDRLRLTPAGQRHLNEVLLPLVPEDPNA